MRAIRAQCVPVNTEPIPNLWSLAGIKTAVARVPARLVVLAKMTLGLWTEGVCQQLGIENLAEAFDPDETDDDDSIETIARAVGKTNTIVWQFIPALVLVATALASARRWPQHWSRWRWPCRRWCCWPFGRTALALTILGHQLFGDLDLHGVGALVVGALTGLADDRDGALLLDVAVRDVTPLGRGLKPSDLMSRAPPPCASGPPRRWPCSPA